MATLNVRYDDTDYERDIIKPAKALNISQSDYVKFILKTYRLKLEIQEVLEDDN